jgi:hypothetical protein
MRWGKRGRHSDPELAEGEEPLYLPLLLQLECLFSLHQLQIGSKHAIQTPTAAMNYPVKDNPTTPK